MRSDFYVYEHVRSDTGAVFYVGKGHGDRAKNFNARSKWWKNVYQKAEGVEVRYLVKNVDEELSLLAEMECIDVYRRRGIKLINITSGGEGALGWVPSEETRKKIGEANKYTPKAKGEKHGMYGKKHTPESLAKMSEAQSKREWGERHPFYGKRHSEEAKQKISENRKGKLTGEDNPFYGKTHTPEALEKIRATHIGRKASEETKAKKKASALAVAPYKQATQPVFCSTNQTWYYGLNEASRKLQLHRQAIRMVCNGKLKQTGGYKFEWSNK